MLKSLGGELQENGSFRLPADALAKLRHAGLIDVSAWTQRQQLIQMQRAAVTTGVVGTTSTTFVGGLGTTPVPNLGLPSCAGGGGGPPGGLPSGMQLSGLPSLAGTTLGTACPVSGVNNMAGGPRATATVPLSQFQQALPSLLSSPPNATTNTATPFGGGNTNTNFGQGCPNFFSHQASNQQVIHTSGGGAGATSTLSMLNGNSMLNGASTNGLTRAQATALNAAQLNAYQMQQMQMAGGSAANNNGFGGSAFGGSFTTFSPGGTSFSPAGHLTGLKCAAGVPPPCSTTVCPSTVLLPLPTTSLAGSAVSGNHELNQQQSSSNGGNLGATPRDTADGLLVSASSCQTSPPVEVTPEKLQRVSTLLERVLSENRGLLDPQSNVRIGDLLAKQLFGAEEVDEAVLVKVGSVFVSTTRRGGSSLSIPRRGQHPRRGIVRDREPRRPLGGERGQGREVVLLRKLSSKIEVLSSCEDGRLFYVRLFSLDDCLVWTTV